MENPKNTFRIFAILIALILTVNFSVYTFYDGFINPLVKEKVRVGVEPLNIPEELALNMQLENVVGIDETENDLFSITTINNDNSRTLYIFDAPIKYKDADTNEIKYINNNIKKAKASNKLFNSAFISCENSFNLSFSQKADEGVFFNDDNYSINFAPITQAQKNSAPELKNIAQKGKTRQAVEYANAFGKGAHVRFMPLNNGFKDEIVLEQYNGNSIFKYSLKLSGLTPETDGQIVNLNDIKTGETAYKIEQAWAKDSCTDNYNMTYSNVYELEQTNDNTWILSMSMDKEFLESPSTVYPVIIDPVINAPNSSFAYGTAYNNISATHIGSALMPGYNQALNSTGMSYMQTNFNFNLGTLQPDFITSAKLVINDTSGSWNSNNASIYRYNYNMTNSNPTYNNMNSSCQTTGNLVTSITLDSSPSNNNEFDIKPLVVDWVACAKGINNTYPQDRGMVLHCPAYPYRSLSFASNAIVINYTISTTSLTLGTWTSTQSIPSAGIQKWYAFTPSQSGSYKFETRNATVNAVGILCNSSGNELSGYTNTKNGNNFSIKHSLVSGTTYLLRVSGSGTSTGSYELRVGLLPTGVSISPNTYTMSSSSTLNISGNVTVSPSNATNKAVTYTSGNTGIVTVSSSGVVTRQSPGAASITVKSAENTSLSANCSVTVNPISSDYTTMNVWEGFNRSISAGQHYYFKFTAPATQGYGLIVRGSTYVTVQVYQGSTYPGPGAQTIASYAGYDYDVGMDLTAKTDYIVRLTGAYTTTVGSTSISMHIGGNKYNQLNWDYFFKGNDAKYVGGYWYFKSPILHSGIDVMAPTGTNIYSPCVGVVKSRFDSVKAGYGVYIAPNVHSQGDNLYIGMYHFNTWPFVNENNTIYKTTIVGGVGNTGENAEGSAPHLHFEIDRTGRYSKDINNNIDPQLFYTNKIFTHNGQTP